MIHAQVDTVDHRQIIAIEYGNRVQFDERHAGDVLWFFLDSYRVLYRVDFSAFQLKPWRYKINEYGDLVISDDAPIIDVDEPPVVPLGYLALKGRDGRYLKNAYGQYILGYDGSYEPPPPGYLYIIDADGTILSDPDGAWLMEIMGDTTFVDILTTESGAVLTEDDGTTAFEDR